MLDKPARATQEVVCIDCGFRPAEGEDISLSPDVDLSPHREAILELIAGGATNDEIMCTFGATAYCLAKYLDTPELQDDLSTARRWSGHAWADRGLEALERCGTRINQAKLIEAHCMQRAALVHPDQFAEKPKSANVSLTVNVNPFAEAIKKLTSQGSALPLGNTIQGEYVTVAPCMHCNGKGCPLC
jgi:hypothetical protein